VTHEGTNQVKESKISMLIHEYELFFMYEKESISDMFTRFTTIVNSLKNLGKNYSNQELVRKILNCLPRTMVATWDDSDPSSSEEESDEEAVNIAFMAIGEEDEDEINFTFDELQNAYENLFNEY
ncbi:UBN2 domain-containing protein, partial [Cephalotus follicularis]